LYQTCHEFAGKTGAPDIEIVDGPAQSQCDALK
jgi:hypothetical protein